MSREQRVVGEVGDKAIFCLTPLWRVPRFVTHCLSHGTLSFLPSLDYWAIGGSLQYCSLQVSSFSPCVLETLCILQIFFPVHIGNFPCILAFSRYYLVGSFWTRCLGECGNAKWWGSYWLQECQWPYEGRMCSLCQSDVCRTKNPLVAISATKENLRISISERRC